MTERAKLPKRDYHKNSNFLLTNPEFTGEDKETALLLLEIIHQLKLEFLWQKNAIIK